MSASLVGSEMCIRDSRNPLATPSQPPRNLHHSPFRRQIRNQRQTTPQSAPVGSFRDSRLCAQRARQEEKSTERRGVLECGIFRTVRPRLGQRLTRTSMLVKSVEL
eukprot:3044282-Alexandrium_andersonii.AAC.1